MPSITFNSGSGNWTIPTGVTSIQIDLWGGGGGGGGGGDAGSGQGASGGAAGGYCQKASLTVTPGGTIEHL